MFIKVHVFPGEKEEKLVRTENDSFEIYTKEPAENGRANRAVIKHMLIYFKNPKGGVQIVSGHLHPKKILVIRDDQFFVLTSNARG